MLNNQTTVGGVFHVQCLDAEGNVKWAEEFPNLVVNTGLQDMNTQYFKGITITVARRMDCSFCCWWNYAHFNFVAGDISPSKKRWPRVS